METFEEYRPRNIEFVELRKSLGGDIKTYTISVNPSFQSHLTYPKVIERLPSFIEEAQAGSSPTPLYQKGFLIVHEGREGVGFFFSGGTMERCSVLWSFSQIKMPRSKSLLPPIR